MPDRNHFVWRRRHGGSLPMPLINVIVPGVWEWRLPNEPHITPWKRDCATPGMVSTEPGRVYSLNVDVNITDEQLTGLAALAGVPAFEQLVLSGCNRLTEAGFTPVRALTNLQTLYLAGMKQQIDDILKQIDLPEGLKKLSLDG